MRLFVAVTDNEWFRYLAAQSPVDEVNFWTPSGLPLATFLPGEPILFKLHAPENVIIGGGFFATFSVLPASIAWETFTIKNGAQTFEQMRRRIARYRRVVDDPKEDYNVGCTVLAEPFFFELENGIPAPAGFHPNIVRGKSYDLATVEGHDLWDRVIGTRALTRHAGAERAEEPIHGEPRLVRPRLGQGAFRVLVTDGYDRRCAITEERALPVLQAAHIRAVSAGGRHSPDNGLLFRADIHALFDRGYVTVTPTLEFRASRKLKEDFDNGENYLALSGRRIRVPADDSRRPLSEHLEWHCDTIFKG